MGTLKAVLIYALLVSICLPAAIEAADDKEVAENHLAHQASSKYVPSMRL